MVKKKFTLNQYWPKPFQNATVICYHEFIVGKDIPPTSFFLSCCLAFQIFNDHKNTKKQNANILHGIMDVIIVIGPTLFTPEIVYQGSTPWCEIPSRSFCMESPNHVYDLSYLYSYIVSAFNSIIFSLLNLSCLTFCSKRSISQTSAILSQHLQI